MRLSSLMHTYKQFSSEFIVGRYNVKWRESGLRFNRCWNCVKITWFIYITLKAVISVVRSDERNYKSIRTIDQLQIQIRRLCKSPFLHFANNKQSNRIQSNNENNNNNNTKCYDYLHIVSTFRSHQTHISYIHMENVDIIFANLRL